MSNTTLTNIPSKLDIRVKEPSGIGAQVPPSGPGSTDRFNTLKISQSLSPNFLVYFISYAAFLSKDLREYKVDVTKIFF